MNPPLISTPPVGLTLETLTSPREKSYFGWVLVVSILAWLVFAITIIGPIYAILIALFLWLGHGLLAAQLRSEAVRVDQNQLAELQASLVEVCGRLGFTEVPALYVLQAGGLLNAFAMRFSGRNFVVVYSDFLEALGPASPEMKFILGHEVGHIKSRHARKQILLAPGLFCPLIGPAYRRAWETSCDRHGAFAAQDVDAAVRAMLVISGGRAHGRDLNAEAFANQHQSDRGFFVSLHELTSSYPTLSRRVTELLALKTGNPSPSPDRNPLAYLFALFVPGGNVTGGSPAAGLMLTVVLMGFLAAMAIPAFQKVREAATAKVCLNNQMVLTNALEQYAVKNNRGPATWADLVGPGKLLASMPVCPQGGSYSAKSTSRTTYVVTCSIPGHNHTAAETPAK